MNSRNPTSALVFAMCLAACPSSKHADEVVPTAGSITIYSTGGSVVSGSFDAALLGNRRLRLPSTAKSVNLSQEGESVKWFTVQTIQDAPKKGAPEAEKKDADEKCRLVGLPTLKPGEVKFTYMLPEITWSPQLEATIVDATQVNLQLRAAITVGADLPFKDCAVTLVLNNAVSVEKLAGQTFSLSVSELYPARDLTYNLDDKVLPYSFVREWNTYVGSDEVHVLLQVNNPFSIDLNRLAYSVESNRINIESGSVSAQSRPGEPLLLGAGVDDSIHTFRAVSVTEAPGKKTLPFNHKISYEIKNTSDQEKKLRVVSQRVMGTEHKSEYHFTRPPDAIPEDSLLWLFTLPPNSTQTLEYDYDADVKDVNGENGFEQGM
jgi:hypothetical protein